MKIISWNIAGGIKYKSDIEDAKYFLEEINKLSPDIVCLQESHINDSRSFAKETFSSSFPFITEFSISPSHNNPEYKLALSILSKSEITQDELIMLPNPNYSRTLANGKIITSHDKALLLCNINNISIANIQLLPVHVFFKAYEAEPEFCEELDQFFLGKLHKPLIFCGDFNNPNPKALFSKSFNKLGLSDSLSGEPTFIYKETNPDHIFYSKDLKAISSKVLKTETDHYLCYAEIVHDQITQ